MVRRLLIIRGLGTCKDPLDATLMGSHEIHGPEAKDGGAAPGQFLDVKLSRQFPTTHNEFRHGIRSVGKVIFLAFHPYKERPKRSKYATWESILVQTAPGLRVGLEIDLDWASNWTCTPLLVPPRLQASLYLSHHHLHGS